MSSRWRLVLALLAGCSAGCDAAFAQEASSGFDLRATLTGEAIASSELTEAPRSGAPMIAASRSVAYPTLKFSDHWYVTDALQLTTRPYYYWDLSTPGYGAKGEVLQSTLNYAHVSRNGSILVRVGEMSTAFGAFVLRYDDADNPLVDLPPEYGYYYSPISIGGVAGAQIDVTRGKWDARAQFANSSPANPRSIFARDQYGNWAGGLGYTIRQGLRVGVSGYRGPYLDRQYEDFYPSERNPSKLPASGIGLEANWAHGHTTVQGELQRFVMPYIVIPTYRETAGFVELKQVLSPRWYVAGRYGYTNANVEGRTLCLETAAGFRPSRFELIKVSYENERYNFGTDRNDNTLGIEFVTTLHKSWGRE
jgi:hypothetical protein